MKKIFLWREKPVDVDIGLWNLIAASGNFEIIELYQEQLLAERSQTGIGSGDFVKNFKSMCVNFKEDRKKLAELIDADSINIFYGFNETLIYYQKLIKKRKFKFVVIAESPKFMKGKWVYAIKNFLLKFKYLFLSKRFNDTISLFFAYGNDGVQNYKKVGFCDSVLKPIMYNSENQTVKYHSDAIKAPLKLVYVGRFDYKYKGLDILINASKNFDKSEILLDLVGGYGKDTQRVLSSISPYLNINYIGSWNQSDVVKRMSAYDICIVPSRCDGWNINVNHAIKAGIACIATNTSTSYELLRYSKSGCIVDPSVDAIKNVFKFAIDHPKQVLQWKHNASVYAPLISVAKMADYMLTCFKALTDNNKKRDSIDPYWQKEYD